MSSFDQNNRLGPEKVSQHIVPEFRQVWKSRENYYLHVYSRKKTILRSKLTILTLYP
jgi:hypothetical protein